MWDNGKGYIKHNNHKYVHRTVVEGVLGRLLRGHEQVHHVDGNTSNYCNTNLVVCPDMAYHKLLHARQKVVDFGGNPNTDKFCSYHKTIHDKQMFSTSPTKYDGLHNNCRDATNAYRKDKGLNSGKFNWKARLNQQYRRLLSIYTHRDISWLT